MMENDCAPESPARQNHFGRWELGVRMRDQVLTGEHCRPRLSGSPPPANSLLTATRFFCRCWRDFGRWPCAGTPAMNNWAMVETLPSAVRRGIFAGPMTQIILSPVGAASPVGRASSRAGSSVASPHHHPDFAPERSLIHRWRRFYTGASPTDFAAFAPCARQKFNATLTD